MKTLLKILVTITITPMVLIFITFAILYAVHQALWENKKDERN